MSDFIESLGPAYFGHLLLRLADEFRQGFEIWDREAGLTAPPRTHSTLRYLDREGPTPVTQLASALRQSHPLVITWIRTLRELGLVSTASDEADARRTIIRLTKLGHAESEQTQRYEAVSVKAFKQLFDECDADVFGALWRIEKACRKQSFADRLRHHSGVITSLRQQVPVEVLD